MKLSVFDYALPAELIAQEPLPRRDDSRMMVLSCGGQKIIHSNFRHLCDFLSAGDCVVLNDTKVIPARLRGKRATTGGRVEVFLLEPAPSSTEGQDGSLWLALTDSRSPLGPGEVINIAEGALQAQVEAVTDDGSRLVRFHGAGKDFSRLLKELGEPPLPPYIKRPPQANDVARYQTVYARTEGAVAAPTAGLHFTSPILESLKERGVSLASLTLHVGLGTFRPVKTECVEDHEIHSERFDLPRECAETVNRARGEGRRVFAVGTTAVRVLESCADGESSLSPQKGRTDLFIYPGYRFKVVNALLTNFHLPRSTLLMLVCAFGGTEFVLRAYQEAVAAGYRFYSYGDCMLLLP